MGKRYRDLVRTQSKAKRSARAVLMLLADYATETGLTWPGSERIAAECGVSARTVTRALAELVALGEIAVVVPARQHSAPRYQITLQGRQTDAPGTVQGRHIDAQGRQPVPARVDSLSARVDSLSGQTSQSGYPDQSDNGAAATAEPEEPDLHEPLGGPRRRSAGERAREVRHTPPPFEPEAYPRQPSAWDYFDPRKLVNGRMPAGRGATPIEVYLESFSPDEMRRARVHFDPTVKAALEREVADLERWRAAVAAWKLSGHKPGNWRGMLDWYRDGPPDFRRNGTQGVPAPSPSKADQTMANFAEYRRLKAAGGA